jgi:hypothetical protein
MPDEDDAPFVPCDKVATVGDRSDVHDEFGTCRAWMFAGGLCGGVGSGVGGH